MSDRERSSTETSSTEAREDRAFDGNPRWKVTRELTDGTVVTIRPLGPEDRDELKRAFEATSPQTRYLRFLRSMNGLSDEALDYLTNVDQRTHVAIVATITSPDLKAERGVGVARFVFIEGAHGVVEAAITVIDDMQRKGLGSILVRELERAARARNVRRIRADVLADNVTMRSLLESVGAEPVDRTNHESPRSPRGVRAGTPSDIDDGTVSYDIALENDRSGSSLGSILRGAAITMALTLRRFLPTTGVRDEASSSGDPSTASERERSEDPKNGQNPRR